jgi:hypothetical protein
MEFWIIENKIRINGKKWDKAMKNLSLEWLAKLLMEKEPDLSLERIIFTFKYRN